MGQMNLFAFRIEERQRRFLEKEKQESGRTMGTTIRLALDVYRVIRKSQKRIEFFWNALNGSK